VFRAKSKLAILPVRKEWGMSQKPVNKWIQSIFWPISVLPSFQHIPNHPTGDYVGRTSPLLGTAFAFWIVAIATIVVALIANGTLPGWYWSGVGVAQTVTVFFLAILYVVGFWLFFSREEIYPN
jgi:hypothetical protein